MTAHGKFLPLFWFGVTIVVTIALKLAMSASLLVRALLLWATTLSFLVPLLFWVLGTFRVTQNKLHFVGVGIRCSPSCTLDTES